MSRVYRESAVDAALMAAVKRAGAKAFKMHPITNAGIPDRIVHWNGETFYVETKETGKKCTPLQAHFHTMLKAVGIETYVLDVTIQHLEELKKVAYKTYENRTV